MKTFGRVLTAMITPFLEDGSVDFDGAVTLANYLLDNGSDGVVVCGTTGEGITIENESKLKLFELIAKECGKKGTIIANTGSNDTKHSIELTQAASKLGVDGIMAVVPYYNKPNQEGCYRHFKAIAESTELPIIVYNVPGRTSSKITPEVLARLANECSNVKAVKEASGDLVAAAEMARLTPKDFMIYSGEDSLTLPLLAIGGCGVISVAAHLAGKDINAMIQAFESGDTARAKELHLYLLPLFKGLFITTNPIPVKTAVSIMGLPAGPFHLPMVDATPEETILIKSFVEQYVK